jgi:stage II sporulation protein D
VVTAYDSSGLALATTAAAEVLVEPVDTTTTLKISFKDSAPAYDVFRGSLRLTVHAGGLQAVNILPLDTYLRGVVASEMPASWPLEALKVQAVAARSYAWSKIRTTGTYDIIPTAGHQVYRGVLNEFTRSNRAVAETASLVLTHNGSVIEAFYHAASGGATEHSEYAFVSNTGRPGAVVAYARGKPDVDANGVPYDSGSPYSSWKSAQFSMAQLSQVMSGNASTDVGEIYEVQFFRGVSGRVYRVYLRGSKGEQIVSGGVFKNTYNRNRLGGGELKSTMYFLTPAPPPEPAASP